MAKKINDLFDVSSKTVLVTGASGFLGREVANLFALNDSTVILLGRSEKVHSVADEIKTKTGSTKIFPYQTDFYNRPQLAKTVATIQKDFPVHVLINNAYDMGPNTGFNTETGRLENLDYETWQRSFESGIYWAFYLSQQIGLSMKPTGGSIINVSSMYGLVSPDPTLYEGTTFFNPATYGVMKSGVLALTRYLAAFFAKENIRCNAVSPGPFSNTQTKSANSVAEDDPFLRKVSNKTVLKRVGKPEELDGVFLLLASDASSYITGQNFVVDGGWTVT